MKSSRASARTERAAAWESTGTLAAANYLAWALREMSHWKEARDLDQDNLKRYRRVLGDEHLAPFAPPTASRPTCTPPETTKSPATWTTTP